VSPSEPAAVDVEGDDLATTIAGHIAGTVAAITVPQTPATTTTAIDIAPLGRALADQENQLGRLTAHIARLERVEDASARILPHKPKW
jgi:hypothetical protein